MISNYIDPKFYNINSLQSNLGDFSKDLSVLIYKSKKRTSVCKRFKIKDTTVQTTLYDFGLKSNYIIDYKSNIKDFYEYKNYYIVNLDYWFFKNVDKHKVVDMVKFDEKKVKFYNKVNKSLYGDSVEDIKTNVHILSDGSFEMLNPRCTNCGSYDVIKKDYIESKPKVEYHSNMKLRLKRYFCKNCGKTFQTKIASIKNDGNRFSKDLREKIRESFANRGGSLDQIANDIEIFLNIEISHQEIKNTLQFDFKYVEYHEEVVTSSKEKQSFTDLEEINNDKIFIVMKKNPEIMGYLVVDELFINISHKRWYCVCFHDITNKNVPFAVGLVKKRTEENMSRLYEIITREMEIISLISDHFKVYESIDDDNKIMHQQCIFHHFDNLNDDIYPFLKDKSLSEIEKISLARQTTEYRNIFRTFDKKECESLWDSFLNTGKDLHEVFIENAEKITEQFLRHTQFTKDNFIPRTSNQAETFHSLPVVRQIKNSAQTPKGFLECMALIMQYYKPKTRKQK